MTKLDHTSKFPDMLLEEDYFIAHIGGGYHQFIKGIDKVFHKLEPIEEQEIIKWIYRPSILNDYSISESSILSLCFNQRIIHDFLYLDIVSNPKIYNSERKRGISFDYKIGDVCLHFDGLQIEIDLTSEYNGYVTIFEGKNTKDSQSWIENFNIYQLYNPFRYYYEFKEKDRLDIKKITACYLVRQKIHNGSNIRLYNYTFQNPLDLTSIILLKKREYQLQRRDFDDS
jgi:hypothetical protein